MKRVARSPIERIDSRVPSTESATTAGMALAWVKTEPTTRTAWVTTKSRKIGVRIFTDSFNPRRFSISSSRMASRQRGTLSGVSACELKDRSAATPLAIEIAIVKT